ncbi:MAG: AMP-binding protein, partial [Spirochaetes bacterium]|nr:AMP-binding protein [Spirochaetota bacterium]
NSAVILKLYPLLMNILFLTAFGGTLFSPPNMIFRFATMQDKSIQGSLNEKRVAAYCRKVTYVWCGFFIVNGSIAAWTIFSGSDKLWSVYNGGISYILIGVLFAGEFMVRKMVQKNMPQSIPLSAFKNNSRPLSTILCYEGTWSDSVYKTWGDFLDGVSELRRVINSQNSDKWLLHCEDCWYFLLTFTALLQCKKEILLSANVSPAYIEEIRSSTAQSAAPFLTDQVFPEGETPQNTFHIPSLLKDLQKSNKTEEAPAINADETSIIMYTSGSTGKPKAVQQRLTEFEADNRFIISKWGDEFLKRKLCSTVSQHHIYGILFSILLPFTLGVPLRRTRIEFPEEIEKLSDTEYMIITVPAFLKRAVEMETPSVLNLKSPWIFTSGGALKFDTAKKTNEVFGFWPVEVYGSTETSGIAWRQSVNGQEWTVFDNAKISQNKDGCLIIRSPYIKNPAGFETADMVEILKDGRFILKGRIDSVVKIEEKRVSFTEIENRILQSGFASDVCVIFLEDKRQYLAAAIVFNSKGKERFNGLEKLEINNFWREYLLQYFENIVIPKKWRYPETLPLDAQGKKKKEDIELLFLGEKKITDNAVVTSGALLSAGFGALEKEKIIEKTENSLSIEFSIPDTSPYFDGHFPGFLILPAVAQTELIIRFAARYLGTGIWSLEIKRVKFTNFIRPFTPLLLKLVKKEKSISFVISSPDNKTVYSTGTVIPENK